MNKANQNQKNIRPRQVTLYRNVFYSRVSTAVVLCLCTSFLLQPIERIYASEPAPNDVLPSIVNLAVDAGLADTVPEEVETVVDEQPVQTTEPEESVTTETVDEAPLATTEPTDIGTTTVEEDTATNDEEEADEGSDDTGTTTVFTDDEIEDLISEADQLPDEESTVSTTTATTTENAVAVSTVFSDAIMQFNRNDCVTVEDGSFYCQSKKEEAEQGTDGMYALQDRDGDLEIFFQKNGELTQLTFNTVDDAAPVFDAKSNTIVWHRLVDERYQIISYSLDTSDEVQLTADNVNNMEPSRSGNYTVWQRWNKTNWDIVLYDGKETKFISDSPLHDIAPKVKGDLVMWNRLASDNTQSIELYNIATAEYTTITDDEGGALSNPRMVLVYETQFENGDVVTKGYNVDTGEITPLANDPAELPEDIPEPDATGETRALVQPKNPVKEDSEFGDDIFPNTGVGIKPTGSSTATSSVTAQSGDLRIASSSMATAGGTPYTASTTQSVTDLTLDMTPPVMLNPDIPADLVVPPFVSDSSANNLEMTQ